MINEINKSFSNILLNNNDNIVKELPLTNELTLPDGKSKLGVDGLEAKVKGKTITPNEGFVIKTKNIKNNIKVYINIVIHNDIDEPSMKKKLNEKGESIEGLNIPMSVGIGRDYIDKSNKNCLIYDIIVNPIVFNESINDKTGKYRDFICQLSIQCIENKYQLEFNKQYILSKLKYIGYDNDNHIHQQYIQDRKNMPKIEEISSKSSESSHSSSITKKSTKSTSETIITPEEVILSYELKWLDHINNVININDSLMNEYVDPIVKLSNDFKSLLFVSEVTSYTLTEDKVDILLSPYIMKIKVVGYKMIKLYFPIAINPSMSSYNIIRKNGYLSIFTLSIDLLIDHTPIDILPDVGSKPWLISQALSIDNDSSTTNMNIYNNYNYTPSDNNKTSNSDNYNSYRNDNIDIDTIELPEDRFHKADAASTYIINQRDQEVKNKIEKHAKEKAERMNDPNVEYIDMDDFKSGDKYENKNKQSSIDQTNVIEKDLSSIEIKKASEIVLQMTYDETIKSDGLSTAYWTELLD